MKAPARQRGAALLVVLSLVAIASVVAMAGVKSALVDERLAGNMRAMAQAQMAADWGGAERLSETPESSGLSACEVARDKAFDGQLMAGWSDVLPISDSETIGYRYMDCVYQATPVQLIRGQVSDGEQVVAQHFIMIGNKATGDGISSLPIPEQCQLGSAGAFNIQTPDGVWAPVDYDCTIDVDSVCMDQPVPCDAKIGSLAMIDDRIKELEEQMTDDSFDDLGCARLEETLFCSIDQEFDGELVLSEYAPVETVVVKGSADVILAEGHYESSIVTSEKLSVAMEGDVTLEGNLISGNQLMVGDANLNNGRLLLEGQAIGVGSAVVYMDVQIDPEMAGDDSDGGAIWIDGGGSGL
ncbi:PilX N-terminal domain-containing pilus assembly protein [Halomonas sp. SCS19]|uniref:pilus assembly PilX family protein n=1 Tax=Halomonas sp. SCS19 TaxID=2950870 RepID=UPI0032DF4851